MTCSEKVEIDWINTIFLIVTPILAIAGTYYYLNFFQMGLFEISSFLFFTIFAGLSITGGYHRLFAHKSYQANAIVKIIYLLGGATFQNSCLKWSNDHRKHHRYVDHNEKDPYSISKGFFYAHIGWIFIKHKGENHFNFSNDLMKDKWVMLQHKYFMPISLFMGFGLPTIIGFAFNTPIGGFLFGGLVRVVFVHHSTFLINSLCHTLGTTPYDDKTSAKDNPFWALFTFGEGYHNFHHKFQNDYRNGIRWYHFDPTKWLIQILKLVKLADRLSVTPEEKILKAKLEMDQKKINQLKLRTETPYTPFNTEVIESLRETVENAQMKFQNLKREYKILRRKKVDAGQAKLRELKLNIKMAKLDFKLAYSKWKFYRKISHQAF